MKRQIVFIMTDTQGTNMLGCYRMTRQRVVEPGEPQQLDCNTGLKIRETTRHK
jgi:hypothetical protein